MQFTAFVPLKQNSRRLPNKNYLQLAGRPLAYHVFNALQKVDSVDKVCAFASSDECMKHVPSGVEFIKRDPMLDLDSVQALEFVRAFAETVPSDYYILAHATSPYISTASLQKGVNAILSGEYDSAIAVSEIKKYFWYDSKPMNFDINAVPQTQDLQPAQFETSGFYMFSREDILSKSRRIGDRPYLVAISDIEAMDIDYIHEFLMARRFQDLLVDEEDASDVPLSIDLIFFALEDILSGAQGEILENVGQWLNILVEQGKKIGVVIKTDQAQILQSLGVDWDVVLTFDDEMSDYSAGDLAREGCLSRAVNVHQSAYVSSSAQGNRVAVLAGMQHFHAGWTGNYNHESDVISFENFGDAVIHFLETGRG